MTPSVEATSSAALRTLSQLALYAHLRELRRVLFAVVLLLFEQLLVLVCKTISTRSHRFRPEQKASAE
jgi:hypothetical protein